MLDYQNKEKLATELEWKNPQIGGSTKWAQQPVFSYIDTGLNRTERWKFCFFDFQESGDPLSEL